jgi:hypothetical protein
MVRQFTSMEQRVKYLETVVSRLVIETANPRRE